MQLMGNIGFAIECSPKDNFVLNNLCSTLMFISGIPASKINQSTKAKKYPFCLYQTSLHLMLKSVCESIGFGKALLFLKLTFWKIFLFIHSIQW